jgi:small multidrug resistance pump
MTLKYCLLAGSDLKPQSGQGSRLPLQKARVNVAVRSVALISHLEIYDLIRPKCLRLMPCCQRTFHQFAGKDNSAISSLTIRSKAMHWIYMVLAILFEVLGTTCMKLSQGFTKTLPSVLLFVFYGACFSMLTLALKKIDVSLAYAVWSGMGTALIATIGILWFKEPLTVWKLISLALIIAGVIGLNLSGSTH